MEDLQATLAKTLGVVAAPPAVAHKVKKGWAPPRPEPEGEFMFRVSRTEYGVAYINAASEEEARELFWDADIDWQDAGDTEIDDIEEADEVNTDQADEWDEKYSNRFDTDGQPMCTTCQAMFDDASDLIEDPDDADNWYCSDCYHTDD